MQTTEVQDVTLEMKRLKSNEKAGTKGIATEMGKKTPNPIVPHVVPQNCACILVSVQLHIANSKKYYDTSQRKVSNLWLAAGKCFFADII